MNKLIVTQIGNQDDKINYPQEGISDNTIVNKLVAIGIDDDDNHTLTYGVDTQDANRPITSIKGKIYVTATYANYLDYISTKYPNLDITSGATYMYFEDSKVEQYLVAAGLGDGVGITTQEAALFDLDKILRNKTDITSFNTFKYFTKANTNPSSSSNEMFFGCTNLSQIDLSNCEILKDDAFRSSGLITVNAPALRSLGMRCFYQCNSLQSVLDLGNISSLGASTFYSCKALISVVLPSSCTSIGNFCFSETSNLSTINLNNITSIGEYGFRNSSIPGVNASTDLVNITSLGQSAFSSTSMVGNLNIPKLLQCGNSAFSSATGSMSKIESIGKLATIPTSMFSSYGATSNMTEVDIPYECTNISEAAFYWLPNLTTIKQYNKSIDEYEEGETKTFFSNISKVTNFGKNAFGGDTHLNISVADIQNALSIGEGSFRNCTLLSGTLNLPNLNSLGPNAFEGTSISSVTGLGNVQNIQNGTFTKCTSLTSVSLPSGTTYGEGCFNNDTALSSISPFPTTFPGFLFRGCVNLQGTISSSTITISGHKTFSNCQNLNFPNELTVNSSDGMIGVESFYSCNIKKIILGSGITTIYSNAFTDCTNLEEIVGLENITTMGYQCFKNTKLSGHINLSSLQGSVPSGRIDNAEQYFGGGMFYQCPGITSIKFGNLPILNQGHHNFGNGDCMFGYCTNLHTIDCDSIGEIRTYPQNAGTTRSDFASGSGWANSTMRNFVIRSTTPPTIVGETSNLHINYFGGPTVTIYVPDSAVQTYKTTWPTVASYIASINNYTQPF